MTKERNRIVGSGGSSLRRGSALSLLRRCWTKSDQARKNKSYRSLPRTWSSISCNFLLHFLIYQLIVYHNSTIALVAAGGRRFTERDR
ncbi:MAG: hypothetical protein ACREDW_10885, partial [Aestuariivirgaceae bacterium]